MESSGSDSTSDAAADSAGQALGESIFLHQRLPLMWQGLNEKEIEGLVRRYNTDNENILARLLALGESGLGSTDSHDSDTELARIEFKLNLLMDLVSCLVSQQLNLPVPRDFKLFSEHLQWQCGEKPDIEPGKNYLVSIWFNEDYPRPVRLFCRCDDVVADNESFIVKCSYGHCSEPVVELLEKLIFRDHRRTIAQRGQQSVSD